MARNRMALARSRRLGVVMRVCEGWKGGAGKPVPEAGGTRRRAGIVPSRGGDVAPNRGAAPPVQARRAGRGRQIDRIGMAGGAGGPLL
ncbi:hypothetical protein [Lysobacter gummosus]|uniref:hypothetical protein n=1 Tax=Lysobacter gummosus TaxID=262324 RepID=UPI00363049DB